MWCGPPEGRLTSYERLCAVILAVLLLAFTLLVLWRSALGPQRLTDAGVFFRAAWAVRADKDMYSVADDHHWRYPYPPPLAIALTPLADPPRGQPRDWMLPYPVSMAIWLALNWAAIFLAAHWTALAVRESSRRAPWPRWSRRWWCDRLHPIFILAAPVGDTISRGQANGVLLACLAAMLLMLVRSRRFASGVWLAAAACLKIFPAILVVWPLWRRDARALAGVAAGLVGLLLMLPVVTMGPTRAGQATARFVDTMILTQVGAAKDYRKVDELARAIDNQSVMAAVHNARNLDRVRREGAVTPDAVDKAVHAVVCGAMLLGSLLLVRCAEQRGMPPARAAVWGVGMLLAVMLAASPLTHLHYAVFALPLVCVLLSDSRDRGGPGWWGWAAIAAFALANLLPQVPGLDMLKLLGLACAANIGLWAAGARELWGWGDDARGREAATA